MRINTRRKWLAAGLLAMTVSAAQAQAPAVTVQMTQEDLAQQNVERTTTELVNLRKDVQIETMMTQSRIHQEALGKINSEILDLEVAIAKTAEVHQILESVHKQPEPFGTLPDSVPCADAIASAYQLLQGAEAELSIMLTKFTERHPDIVVARKGVEVYRAQLENAVQRAFATATANLTLQTRQRDTLVPMREEIVAKLGAMEIQIVSAQLKLDQLQRERELAQDVWADLVRRKADERAERERELEEMKLRQF